MLLASSASSTQEDEGAQHFNEQNSPSVSDCFTKCHIRENDPGLPYKCLEPPALFEHYVQTLVQNLRQKPISRLVTETHI